MRFRSRHNKDKFFPNQLNSIRDNNNNNYNYNNNKNTCRRHFKCIQSAFEACATTWRIRNTRHVCNCDCLCVWHSGAFAADCTCTHTRAFLVTATWVLACHSLLNAEVSVSSTMCVRVLDCFGTSKALCSKLIWAFSWMWQWHGSAAIAINLLLNLQYNVYALAALINKHNWFQCTVHRKRGQGNGSSSSSRTTKQE